MNQNLTFSRATSAELPAVMEIINSRVQWLSLHGSQQWNSRDFAQDMERAIACNATWVLRADASPVGVINLTTIVDPDFWTVEEQVHPSLYIGRMATHWEVRGRRLGELLLKLSRVYASQNHLPRVRWDVWRGNQRLYNYYESLGGKHLRTVEAPDRGSGALFEIAYKGCPQLPHNVNIVDPITTIEIPSSKLTPWPYEDETSTGFRDGVLETHYHEVAGVGLSSPGSTQGLTIPSFDNVVKCVYFSGGGWHLHDFENFAISRWNGLPSLQEGQPYSFRHVSQEPGVCGTQLVGPCMKLEQGEA